MLRATHPLRKYLVLGALAAAPIVTAGCNNNACQIQTASPCTRTTGYTIATQHIAPAPRAVAATPVVINQTPVVYNTATPATYIQKPIYVDNTVTYATETSGVTYKPMPSRSLAHALANVDNSSLAATNSGLVSSVMSATEYAAMTSGRTTAGAVTYPEGTAQYATQYATQYPVAYPMAYQAAGTVTTTAAIPAGGYVVSEEPAYSVPVAAGVNPNRRGGRPGRRFHRPATVDAPVYVDAQTGIPNGTPVYITPGGTTVSAYVPAPASGTYLGGAAPTGYLPVTERRGPNNAVVHYATRSICKYDPATGEDCVWTSGF